MNAASTQMKSAPNRRSEEPDTSASIESTVLKALGECVYEWSIKSDALRWSEGAAALLAVGDEKSLATGRTF
ncbi:hypothetical protein N9H93_04365, partial [Rhizobiaceae bacterium]|nr:hypothetical protein [Rhizobiaceae bacterium]